MQPTVVRMPEPVLPQGSWVRRAWMAIVCEHRLPTRVAEWWDRALIALGFPTRTIRAGPCRFRVRRLTADIHFVREIVDQRGYSPSGYEVGPNDVVVDIGGNIGAFAVFAGQRARDGVVISVEPVAANFQLLCHNLRLNRLTQVVPLRAAVVGRVAGTTSIFVSPRGSGHHSMLSELAGGTQYREDVPAVRIEDLLEQYQLARCDLLKLDCEGAEFEILESLSPEIAQRIRRIVLEYHVLPGGDKLAEAGRLIRCLEGNGFRVETYTDVEATNHGLIFARR